MMERRERARDDEDAGDSKDVVGADTGDIEDVGEDESGVGDIEDVEDVVGIEDVVDAPYLEEAETNPDLEDPRLYSPLLAHDDPCLKRRRAESAAAGRSMTSCEKKGTVDEKPTEEA